MERLFAKGKACLGAFKEFLWIKSSYAPKMFKKMGYSFGFTHKITYFCTPSKIG
jgi:hypothetical protein